MADVQARTLGQIIDDLGVTMESLDDTCLISDVVVLAKTVRMDTGRVSLFTAHSTNISWIEKVGMLRAAEAIENSGYSEANDVETP